MSDQSEILILSSDLNYPAPHLSINYFLGDCALGKNHTHRLIFANSAIENVLFQLSRHLSRVMYRLYHEVERPEVVSIA